MIPVSSLAWQGESSEVAEWQHLLQTAVTDPTVLCQRLQLSLTDESVILEACRGFPLKVPEPYLARMETGNSKDPLLLQILPQAAELSTIEGYTNDPLGESAHNPVPGLVHKYASRVLLITTSLCAVHCRYCFRRAFPYSDNRNSRASWQTAMDYIRQNTGLNEVILSGGDPLSLPDRQLAWLTRTISDIPHIVRLRFHTRLPVVIPQRITTSFLNTLDSRLQNVMVLHCNHPNEVDTDLATAVRLLRQRGVTVLNQSVLLAGINDSAEILVALSEKLFAAGIQPYYLHQLDKVSGSHHFAVPDAVASALHKAIQTQLPGFLVPTLAREEAGEPSKTRLL